MEERGDFRPTMQFPEPSAIKTELQQKIQVLDPFRYRNIGE